MPTGPSPNNSPENNLPLSSDALSTNSASHRSPPALPKPKAASSAPGALARTVWSANFASPTPPLWSQPIPCSPASAPTTTSASPVPPPSRPPLHPPPPPPPPPGPLRLPPPPPPLRSRPLPRLALSTRGRTRSHRHLGRVCHCPAPLARPSRLCRRNRRTLASTGGYAARLSRGCSTARSASAARRTRRTPSQVPDLGAEKKNPDASHL